MKKPIAELLSSIGRILGNWNDKVNATGDRRSEHPKRWHVIDRLAMRLYIWPDRRWWRG